LSFVFVSDDEDIALVVACEGPVEFGGLAQEVLRVGGLAGWLRDGAVRLPASMVVTFFVGLVVGDVEAGEVGVEDFAFGFVVGGRRGDLGSGLVAMLLEVEGCDGDSAMAWFGGDGLGHAKACPTLGL